MDHFDVGTPQRIPGALESYWELAVDIGLISAPIGIVCNMIASWLFEALKRKPPNPDGGKAVSSPLQVKLVVRIGAETKDIQIELGEFNKAKSDLEAALSYVDFQQ